MQEFNITITKKLFRHLNKIFPKEMSWEEIIRELLDRVGLPAPPLTLNQIRATCQHSKMEVKSNLYPNPEEIWKWCPRCQLLVEKIV